MAKQDTMFALIERWERSGLTKAEFAREAGVSINTFHYWFRRYDAEHSSSSPAFVEVAAEPSVAIANQPAARLHLEFPDGLTITVY